MQTDAAGLADPSRPADAQRQNRAGANGTRRVRVRPGPETGRTGAGPGGPGKLARGIARGALIIAVLTACSRILGLLRTVVFAQTVGAGCLGTAYVTANQVPNLIYELAIGGALTSAMVPVLARSASRAADRPAGRRHTSSRSPRRCSPGRC